MTHWTIDIPVTSGLYQYKVENELFNRYVFLFFKKTGLSLYCSTLGEISIEYLYQHFNNRKIEWFKL